MQAEKLRAWLEDYASILSCEFSRYADAAEVEAALPALLAIAEAAEDLRVDNERLRSAFDDTDEKASVHWYMRWIDVNRLLRRWRATGDDTTAEEGETLRADTDAALSTVAPVREGT